KLLFLLESEGGNQAMTDSLAEEDRFFAQVDEAYRIFTANPELMYLYEARRKGQMDKATSIAEARREGITEGKAEGLAEGKAETARRLRELGADLEIIIQATGLSKEEIEAL
ncbi:MAG: hypothetical protein Q8M76_00170, partial [Spirochaetaceae bacterium]|nr:hypothetical protein [Spirochaetaceae bacterium]